MDQQFCPGAKILRQPKPEMYSCSNCGEEVEIWSDERKRPCPNCGETVVKDSGDEQISCLDWCAMGEECVGEKAYRRYKRLKAESLKTRLLNTLAEWCKNEELLRRMKEEILPTAEKLVKEKGGDPHIVFPTLIFRKMKPCWCNSHNLSEKNNDSLESDYEKFVEKNLFKEGLQTEAIQEIISLLLLSTGKEKGEGINSTIILTTESK